MGVIDGVINVKDSPYNAKGDDRTNDREAIQRAIDEATRLNARGNPVHPRGVVIYFPKGTCVIKGEPLVLPRLPFYRMTFQYFTGQWFERLLILSTNEKRKELRCKYSYRLKNHGARYSVLHG